jgi:hypothetical protein
LSLVPWAPWRSPEPLLRQSNRPLGVGYREGGCSPPGKAFVPFVRADLYEALATVAGVSATSPEPRAASAPTASPTRATGSRASSLADRHRRFRPPGVIVRVRVTKVTGINIKIAEISYLPCVYKVVAKLVTFVTGLAEGSGRSTKSSPPTRKASACDAYRVGHGSSFRARARTVRYGSKHVVKVEAGASCSRAARWHVECASAQTHSEGAPD